MGSYSLSGSRYGNLSLVYEYGVWVMSWEGARYHDQYKYTSKTLGLHVTIT
jgi:hypothetical protein